MTTSKLVKKGMIILQHRDGGGFDCFRTNETANFPIYSEEYIFEAYKISVRTDFLHGDNPNSGKSFNLEISD